jgi:hypothetical protein
MHVLCPHYILWGYIRSGSLKKLYGREIDKFRAFYNHPLSSAPLLIFTRSLVTCSVLPSRSRNRIGEGLPHRFRHAGRVLHVGPTGFLQRLSLPTESGSNPSARSRPRRSLPRGTLAPAETESVTPRVTGNLN